MDDELFDEADIRSRINNVNARTVDAVMPLQGIRGRRSLGVAYVRKHIFAWQLRPAAERE